MCASLAQARCLCSSPLAMHPDCCLCCAPEAVVCGACCRNASGALCTSHGCVAFNCITLGSPPSQVHLTAKLAFRMARMLNITSFCDLLHSTTLLLLNSSTAVGHWRKLRVCLVWRIQGCQALCPDQFLYSFSHRADNCSCVITSCCSRWWEHCWTGL